MPQVKRKQWLPMVLALLLSLLLLLTGCTVGGNEKDSSSPTEAAEPVQSQPADSSGEATETSAGPEEQAASTEAEATPGESAAGQAAGTADSPSVSKESSRADSAGKESAADGGSQTEAAKPDRDTSGDAAAGTENGKAAERKEDASTGGASKSSGSKASTPTESTAHAGSTGSTAGSSTSSSSAAVQDGGSKEPAAADSEPVQNIVTVSITGDEETGTIMPATSVELQAGDTALEVLKRVTRSSRIPMEYRGAEAVAYIEGIDNLYEFDHGPKSGWMFRINGQFPSVSAGAYILKAGDRIEWLYTLDLGADIGAKAD